MTLLKAIKVHLIFTLTSLVILGSLLFASSAQVIA